MTELTIITLIIIGAGTVGGVVAFYEPKKSQTSRLEDWMSEDNRCDQCGALWVGVLVVVNRINYDPGHPSHDTAREERWCVDCVMTYWTGEPA